MLITYSAHIVLGLLFSELALAAWILNIPETEDTDAEPDEDDTVLFV
jgi:hypothetical protein